MKAIWQKFVALVRLDHWLTERLIPWLFAVRVKQIEDAEAAIKADVEALPPELRSPDLTHVIAAGLTPPVDTLLPTPFVRRSRRRKNRDKWLSQTSISPVREPAPLLPKLPKPRKPHKPLQHDAPRATLPNDTPWDFSRESEDAGVFYFRGALLDELDAYFWSISRMKRAHSGAYDLYSQVGGTLVPNEAVGATFDLPAWWHDTEHRPGFGCIYIAPALGEKTDRHFLYPHLIYFEKMEKPNPEVEPVKTGNVYQISAYFDEHRYWERNDTDRVGRAITKWLRKHGWVFPWHMVVETNGDIRLLKELQTKHHRITYRSGHHALSGSACSGKQTGGAKAGGGQATRKMRFSEAIPYKVWDYPEHLREWYDDHIEREPKFTETTIEQWTANFFTIIAQFTHVNDLGARITVTNEQGASGSFAVDFKRLAYFFKDRDVTLTAKGKKARIFHIVRPHERVLANGKKLYVKMHFSGLRRFKWGKFSVWITVPGLHHITMAAVTMGSSDFEAMTPEEREHHISAKEMGHMLSEHISGKSIREAFADRSK